jgi:hypothetical protein
MCVSHGCLHLERPDPVDRRLSHPNSRRLLHKASCTSTLSLATVVTRLLPHLDTLDLHLAVLLPCRVPLLLSLPEVLLGSLRAIEPRLVRLAVLKPTVSSTNSDVDDEVEVLVKGRGVAASRSPGVIQTRTVAVSKGEVAVLEKWLVKVRVHDLKKTSVDVCEDVVLGPLDTEGVVTSGVGRVQGLALDVVTPPAIVAGVRAEVQSTGCDVVSALCIGVVISARLHDVDLTGSRPVAINVVLGQHPNRGPEPVALGKLSLHLNAAVLDRSTELGVDATGLDRVDDCTIGGVGDGDTVGELSTSAAAATQIDDVVIVDQALILKSRLDNKNAILEEDVLVSVGGLLKLPVTVIPSVTVDSTTFVKLTHSHQLRLPSV